MWSTLANTVREFLFEDGGLQEEELKVQNELSKGSAEVHKQDEHSQKYQQIKDMAHRSGQSVPEEDILIPLRWAQYLGCRDEERLPQLARHFFAMEMGFEIYKSQLEDYNLVLYSQKFDMSDTKDFSWVYDPPEQENDRIFQQKGIEQPHFENSLLESVNYFPIDRLLEKCILNCSECKVKIKELIHKLKFYQGQSTSFYRTEKEKTEELRTFCVENLRSFEGLIIVHSNLEKQLEIMRGMLEVSPETEFERILEDPEILKSYAVGNHVSLPRHWGKVTTTSNRRNLLTISSEITHLYKTNLEETKQIVRHIKIVRQQRQVASAEHMQYHTARDHSSFDVDQMTTEDLNKFKKLFVMWKGISLVQKRLQNGLDRCTREFSMEIQQSEEERNFNNDEYLNRLGENIYVECPREWEDKSSRERYRKTMNDMEKQYSTSVQKVQQIVQELEEKRKTRQHLQHVHQKWKGLELIHRTLNNQEEMLSEAERTVTRITGITEEERHVENEEYILHYADARDKSGDLEVYKNILSETDCESTIKNLISAIQQLMEENKRQVKRMCEKRKGIKEKAGLFSVGNLDTKQETHSNDRAQQDGESTRNTDADNIQTLKREKRDLELSLQKLARDSDKNKEELRQWAIKDADTIIRLSEKDTECDKLTEKYKNLNKQFTKLNEAYQQKEEETRKRKKITPMEWEKIKQKFDEQKDHINYLEIQLNMEQEKARDLVTEKENLLTRLSKIAGAKLTQGNAAITDLSDPDRPMKIAEKYSELYDNQWTDALEELIENGSNDDEGIAILLKIITEAYTFCSKVVLEYQQRMLQSVTCLPMVSFDRRIPLAQNQHQMSRQPLESPCLSEHRQSPEPQSSQNNTSLLPQKAVQLTEEQKRDLDDLKKALLPQMFHQVEEQYGCILDAFLLRYNGAKVSVEDETVHDCEISNQLKNTQIQDIEKELPTGPNPSDDQENTEGDRRNVEKTIEKEQRDELSLPKTRVFATKCVRLCWMMRIKDQPLHMMYNIEKGTPMDTNLFKHYTQSGYLVKFVVWPALFLHENGSLLTKGVAQPMIESEGENFSCKGDNDEESFA